jgi:hypothetical protein
MKAYIIKLTFVLFTSLLFVSCSEMDEQSQEPKLLTSDEIINRGNHLESYYGRNG